jgi:20S proteasome alpha/beta subunit
MNCGNGLSSVANLFLFVLFSRNNFLADKGVLLPKATSTGTTIVGCLFKDGIVLGADTRATEGEIVADKNCEKVLVYTHSV